MKITKADNYMAALGVETYRVGGSVRDELLGRKPKDADYMVRGTDLKRLRELLCWVPGTWISPLKLRDGIQAGWRVSRKEFGSIEIMLPRTEISTGPGHRDFAIRVDPNVTLEEDAKRRDFTFNALYRCVGHAADGPSAKLCLDGSAVIDPTGAGLFDLERGYIRTTHEHSFRDDPLRMLRALRFVSARGFDIASDTERQMYEYASAITGLTAYGYASGTVYDELCKILMGNEVAAALTIARDSGVLGTLFSGLAPMLGFDQGSRYHDLPTCEHTFMALETAAKVDAPLRVRLALLFHDAGKPASAWIGKDGRKHYYAPDIDSYRELYPDADSIPNDHEVESEWIWRDTALWMGVDKRTRDDVSALILRHMVSTDSRAGRAATRVRRMRVELGDELLADLLMMRMCDITGKASGADPEQLQRLALMEKMRREAVAAGVPKSVKDLQIGGLDITAMGGYGSDIGKTLRAVLDEVVVDPCEQKLSREWQLQRAAALVR